MKPHRAADVVVRYCSTSGSRSRSPSGTLLLAAVPHGNWHTTTFVAGPRQIGIVAPLALDCLTTGAVFRAYVAQFLAPALAPDDVVVLDNLAAHKVDGVKHALAAAGASLLYLPPCSPDLNPIEQLFAKLKARRCQRKIEYSARMPDSNLATIDFSRFFGSDPGGSTANLRYQNFALTMPSYQEFEVAIPPDTQLWWVGRVPGRGVGVGRPGSPWRVGPLLVMRPRRAA